MVFAKKSIKFSRILFTIVNWLSAKEMSRMLNNSVKMKITKSFIGVQQVVQLNIYHEYITIVKIKVKK